MKCSKCGSAHRLEDHHVHPKVFFGRGRDNKYTVKLCHDCHCTLEQHILMIEAFVYRQPYGQRYRLEESDYERILRNFVRKSEIIYLEAS